jgi:hypothetical protein
MTSAQDQQKKGAKTARIVISALLILGTGMGFLLYFKVFKTYSVEATSFRDEMNERGKELSVEECAEAGLAFFERCESPPELCHKAITEGVVHCLSARDRTAECGPYADEQMTRSWTFEKCTSLGIEKRAKNLTKSCTRAWDALDQFCKSGQKGAIL